MARQPERGGAMLVALVVLAVLLAGASAIAALELRSTRSAASTVNAQRSLYCAEAGIATAHHAVAANFALRNTALCSPAEEPCSEVAWLAPGAVSHELDSPAVPADPPDFQILLKDNVDDAPNDLDTDSDGLIFIVSTCLKYPDVQRQVSELVSVSGGVLTRKLWLVTQ